MTPTQMNEAFIQKCASPDAVARMGSLGGDYIKDRLREVSYLDKVIAPKYVTRGDCQVSTRTDTLSCIVELEPESRALVMGFRGDPRARTITGKRVEAGFTSISTEIYQKTEQELAVYTLPITKIIEENMVKDMQEMRDREFTIHVEACVQALQTQANGGTSKALCYSKLIAGGLAEFAVRKGSLARTCGVDDATVRPVQKNDLVEGYKMLDGNRLSSEITLITQVDFDDTLQWTLEDNGDSLQSQIQVSGWTANTFHGRRYIRTIKNDILRPGNIFFFTNPNFLGRNYILNGVKFYIDKVANNISFQAWMDVAPIIVNIASVRKVELYSGDANPSTDFNGLVSNFTPVSEEGLGVANNQVGLGLVFPKVSTSNF